MVGLEVFYAVPNSGLFSQVLIFVNFTPIHNKKRCWEKLDQAIKKLHTWSYPRKFDPVKIIRYTVHNEQITKPTINLYVHVNSQQLSTTLYWGHPMRSPHHSPLTSPKRPCMHLHMMEWAMVVVLDMFCTTVNFTIACIEQSI